MEKEFARGKGSGGCLSVDAKGPARNSIAMFLSLLLVLQIMLVGFQAFGAQAAYGATLPNNLVYEYAYGVRSDGVAVFRNNGYDGVIINSSGKVVFKEVYKEETFTYTNPDGKQESYTNKVPSLMISGDFIHADYYGGNLIVYKNVNNKSTYGLLDPKTGKYVLQPNYSYNYVLKYCKNRSWSVGESVIQKPDTTWKQQWKLPDGSAVQYRYVTGKGYVYVKSNDSIAKVAGYELGNPSAVRNDDSYGLTYCVPSRVGIAGGNLYYVHNSKNKVGAVDAKGKVLIPFEYDAYFDAGVGSSYILLKKNGSWSYFDLNTIGKSSSSSAAQTAKWMKGSKGWWYRYANGSYATGLKKIGNATYYFDSNGWMKTGWQKISGSWYYFASSGAMKTGWQKVGRSWYLMASSGKMLTGWQTVSGKRYYLSPSGAMKTGWLKDGGAWYYLNDSGAMVKGWTKTGGKWYYMNSAGKMLTGWQTVSGKKYYLSPSGAMKTGWLKDGGAWYYLNGSGAMVSNRWVGDYYMGSDGKMATNTWVDNGKYYVGKDGVWVRGKKK